VQDGYKGWEAYNRFIDLRHRGLMMILWRAASIFIGLAYVGETHEGAVANILQKW
jgi:hypothetical protein